MVIPLPLAVRYRWVVRLGLMGYAATTIIGWAIQGPVLPTAYIAKAIEVVADHPRRDRLRPHGRQPGHDRQERVARPTGARPAAARRPTRSDASRVPPDKAPGPGSLPRLSPAALRGGTLPDGRPGLVGQHRDIERRRGTRKSRGRVRMEEPRMTNSTRTRPRPQPAGRRPPCGDRRPRALDRLHPLDAGWRPVHAQRRSATSSPRVAMVIPLPLAVRYRWVVRLGLIGLRRHDDHRLGDPGPVLHDRLRRQGDRGRADHPRSPIDFARMDGNPVTVIKQRARRPHGQVRPPLSDQLVERVAFTGPTSSPVASTENPPTMKRLILAASASSSWPP